MSTSCDDQQIAYLEGATSAVDHVRECATCQAVVRELDDIRGALDDPAMWDEPDPGLEDRIVSAIEADTTKRADNVVSLGARRRLRDRLTPVLVGSVAAALLIGAVLGGGLSRIADRGKSADAEVALSATPLAPDARGDAEFRNEANGVEIRLHLKGLPPAPAGFYYQAWLKGDKGLVPIGTFHTGDGEVILWSGVSLDQYPTITITVEEDNGDQASSGKRVLVGDVRPR